MEDEEVSNSLIKYTQNSFQLLSVQEFKAQTFGGEYTGEVYDHVLKK